MMQVPPTLNPAPTLSEYNWAEEFRAFSGFHWLVVIICFGFMGAVCLAGRRRLRNDFVSGEDSEARLRRLIGWSILLTQGFIFVRRMVYFDLQDSLPLHLCRLGVWIAAWQMLSLDRRARSLTLFWGLGLSLQVFFTPFIHVGYGHLSFWIYWLNHVQIVGCAIYDIWVLGYRPSWKDLRFASILGVVYALVVNRIDVLLHVNYSYLGTGTESDTSIVDQLGPYPQRVVWMILGSLVVFALIYGISSLALYIRTRLLKKPPPRFIGPDQPGDATLIP